MSKGWAPPHTDTQPFCYLATRNISFEPKLSAYSEHLGPTYGTHTLSSRPTILHGYVSGIPHLSLGPALHTVCLHLFTSLFLKG